MFKKFLKIIGIISGSVFIIFLLIYSFYYYQYRAGNYLKFNDKWYTKEEFEKIRPLKDYDTPEKNTPEQVYIQFREALLKDDIETALNLITERKREEYRKEFNDKEIVKKYKEIPKVEELIKSKSNSFGNFANYYYFKGKRDENTIPYEITFEKNIDGYWQIDGI